jgi:peptide-methionine (S)-S-oxide reductase
MPRGSAAVLAAIVSGGLLAAGAASCGKSSHARSAGRHRSAQRDMNMKTEKATFAAGCFWGVEAEFSQIKGVIDTACGYSGGTTKDPTYQEVCSDRTGHAEVVQVEYDPAQVSYEALLEAFFNLHDPTTLNRQGPDVGTQYRSAVFTHTPEQDAAARAFKGKLERSGRFNRPIVTIVAPAGEFYRAEEYHQRYFEKRGMPSCHVRH